MTFLAFFLLFLQLPDKCNCTINKAQAESRKKSENQTGNSCIFLKKPSLIFCIEGPAQR